MPANGPARPQARFWIASAKAKVSRVQPRSIVIGCSHRPKPWRMPMLIVTIAAPHSSTCVIDRRAGVEAGFIQGFCRKTLHPVGGAADTVAGVEGDGMKVLVLGS